LNYQIVVEKGLGRDVRDVSHVDRSRIDKAIQALAVNPRPAGCTKLTAREGYRIRVGNYRVLYTIDDPGKVVVIYRIKHRKEVYR
jgi:mRNA interferase RelE/StbE